MRAYTDASLPLAQSSCPDSLVSRRWRPKAADVWCFPRRNTLLCGVATIRRHCRPPAPDSSSALGMQRGCAGTLVRGASRRVMCAASFCPAAAVLDTWLRLSREASPARSLLRLQHREQPPGTARPAALAFAVAVGCGAFARSRASARCFALGLCHTRPTANNGACYALSWRGGHSRKTQPSYHRTRTKNFKRGAHREHRRVPR